MLLRVEIEDAQCRHYNILAALCTMDREKKLVNIMVVHPGSFVLIELVSVFTMSVYRQIT